MAVRAGIYARISSDREGDNLAISRHLAECEALAERRGWAVAEPGMSMRISAPRGKPRHEYRRMLDDIEAGAIAAGVVYHADRLYRRPRELEDFIDLCARIKTKMGDRQWRYRLVYNSRPQRPSTPTRVLLLIQGKRADPRRRPNPGVHPRLVRQRRGSLLAAARRGPAGVAA